MLPLNVVYPCAELVDIVDPSSVKVTGGCLWWTKALIMIGVSLRMRSWYGHRPSATCQCNL
jgi:hypothetical protein